VVPGSPLSLVTVAKFNISARGKYNAGRTQQLFPGCVNIGSLAAILRTHYGKGIFVVSEYLFENYYTRIIT
jgi:hypothetical protein